MTTLDQVAHEHVGEAGPADSCLHAINAWVREAGGKALPTDSVSQAVQLVGQQGDRYGWAYHDGLDGVRVGDVLRWARSALGPTASDPNPEHVSVYTAHDSHGNLQSVGSGGPTGKVALQPQGGGFNPARTFRGYFRVSLDAPAPSKPAAPAPSKPASSSKPAGRTIRVARGDNLWQLARDHKTTVAAFLRANPRAADGRSADYHIARQDLIIVGQRLHLP